MDNELNAGELLFKQKKSALPTIFTYVLIFILAVLVVFYLFFGLTTVDGTSMEDTIYDKQQVFLLKNGYSIERGDIVTVNVGTRKDPHELIKRVIAISGDKLVYVLDNSNTYVEIYICKRGEKSFRLLNEPYIKERMTLKAFNMMSTSVKVQYDKETIESIDLTKQYGDGAEQIKQKLLDSSISIPDKCFFFLGDNRNNSNDSRHYGARSYSSINGKMLTILKDGSAAAKLLNFLF